MGAISPIHIAIVLIIALVVFGPKRIPQLGKSVGSALHEFQKGAKDLQESLGMDGLDLMDNKEPKQIEAAPAAAAAPAAQAQPPADTTVSASASVQAPLAD